MPASTEPALDRPSPGDPVRRGLASRTVWLGFGLLFVAIGVAGIFVPLLPTTDFMLLALPCFARSSPRLEAWLLNHPRIGPPLRAWREQRTIPRRGKIAACIGMSLGFGVFWLAMRPEPVVLLAVGTILLACAAWIVTRRLAEPRP